MTYKHAIFVIIVLCVSNYMSPAFSSESNVQQESELSRVIKKIKERETTLKTFTATFKQTNTSDLLREPLHSEGIVYFDMDGRMLMKVISPSPLILLLKENRRIVYYPDIAKTEEASLGTTDNILRQFLHIGESIKTLKETFEIELAASPSGKNYNLKMT